jgi:hypothetical protein
MDVRHAYLAGLVLGLVGCLAVVAGLAVGGQASFAVLVLLSALVFVLGIRNVREREAFDRDHSLGYRLGNWGGALVVVALGLGMLAVGVATLGFFG